MFYITITPAIREYINKIPSQHFGCKYYCPLQIIALDELELLRKELALIGIKLSNSEFKQLITEGESKYFHNVHICRAPKTQKEIEEEEKSIEENLKNNLKGDKIPKKQVNPFVDFDNFERNYKLRQKQKEEDEKLFNKSTKTNQKNMYTSLSQGISMIVSLFLIVIGSYFFSKQFLGLSDSACYKVVLVVTIIVFISESCLLLLRLHKEQMSRPYKEGIKTNSFAYKFNKDYRKKITTVNDMKVKKKVE